MSIGRRDINLGTEGIRNLRISFCNYRRVNGARRYADAARVGSFTTRATFGVAPRVYRNARRPGR